MRVAGDEKLIAVERLDVVADTDETLAEPEPDQDSV